MCVLLFKATKTTVILKESRTKPFHYYWPKMSRILWKINCVSCVASSTFCRFASVSCSCAMVSCSVRDTLRRVSYTAMFSAAVAAATNRSAICCVACLQPTTAEEVSCVLLSLCVAASLRVAVSRICDTVTQGQCTRCCRSVSHLCVCRGVNDPKSNVR